MNGENWAGRPPTGPQPAGVHPAPDRPGTSVNHSATPSAVPPTGSPAHHTALRIGSLPCDVRTGHSGRPAAGSVPPAGSPFYPDSAGAGSPLLTNTHTLSASPSRGSSSSDASP